MPRSDDGPVPAGNRPGPVRTGHRPPPRQLMIAAVVLTGLTMRIAVGSVGAVLTELRAGLHASSAAAGVLTTLPVIAFALIGFLGPRLAHRFGEHRVLVAALGVSTVGLLSRALAGNALVFGALSALALTGGALTNVLMPALVKRHFPDSVPTMTAVYTTSLAVGITAGAGLSVPLGELSGQGWRFGIGVWAALTAAAMLPWLPTLAAERPGRDSAPTRIPLGRLVRSRLAWALTLMFGFQAVQAYIAFGWFAAFFRDHGVGATEAGLLLAFFSALSIPVSVAIPTLAARDQRRPVVVLTVCGLVGYIGMLVAPVGGAWVWMLLEGVAGGMFPLALTMIGLRSRAVPVTASLSAFAQGIGYLLSGGGPVLIGVLLGASNDWTWPLVTLLVATAAAGVAGWDASRAEFVDDQLTPAREAGSRPAA